jgi:flagellum-specific peptidoglycan hydrolase FlgJ
MSDATGKKGELMSDPTFIVGLSGLAFLVGWLLFGRKKEAPIVGPASFFARLWTATYDVGLATVPRIILIAQAAHESGWGSARTAKLARNYWNVTAGIAWKGPVLSSGDLECKNSSCKPITQRFRVYTSDREAVLDIIRFLRTPRYSNAYARLIAGDTEGYLSELRKAGYFTAPLETYTRAINGIIPSLVKLVTS